VFCGKLQSVKIIWQTKTNNENVFGPIEVKERKLKHAENLCL